MSREGKAKGHKKPTATLALVGDVMLGRLINREMARRRPESFWGDALPVLRGADAVFANLECAISAHRAAWSRTYKVFHFRADPVAVDVLRAGNVRYVSLANNHVLDFEEQGLRDTLRHLDKAGIKHAGAGRDLAEAMTPAILDVAGYRIGVISLTDNEPAFAARADRPGTYYTPIETTPAVLAPIERRIARLADAGADLIVLSVHWGPNMVRAPRPDFRRFADAVLTRGIDVVHGHSAHIYQGVVGRAGQLVLYDTGDFLDDYAVDPALRNDWSFIFLIDLDMEGLVRLRMRPVRLRLGRVDLARNDEFEQIRSRMLSASAELGSSPVTTDEGLMLALR